MPITLSPDESYAKSALAVHNPAADTAAVVTVTPKSGELAMVDWIVPSWDTAPDFDDTVILTIGGTEAFRWRPGEVTSVQGPQLFGPWVGEKDEAIVVTVSAPSGGTIASLSVKYRKQATIT